MGLCAIALADAFLLTAEAALFIVDRVVPTSRVAAVEAKRKGSRLLLFLTGRSTPSQFPQFITGRALLLSLTEVVGWQATVCAASTTGFTVAERLDRGVEEEGTKTEGEGVDVAAA